MFIEKRVMNLLDTSTMNVSISFTVFVAFYDTELHMYVSQEATDCSKEKIYI